MFGWRRRSEGFEWKEYVRTTVLVRRADRQRRLEDARLAAIEKVRNVADAGVGAGRASASAAKSGLFRLLAYIGRALADVGIASFWALVRAATFASRIGKDAMSALFEALREVARVPAEAARDKLRLVPDVARKSPIKAHHLISAVLFLGLVYVGGPMLRSADGVGTPTVDISSGSFKSSEPSHQVTVSTEISGPAIVLTGDTMRVDGTLVRLAGIEAPATAQPCYRANGRRWNCASAARAGLNRLVRGRTITCTPARQESDGATLAHCLIDGGKDVATELVRGGYAFATDTSFFSSLASEENAARDAKRGIWQGEVMRPQDWRDQVWEAAKHDAPDGCPIKGIVRASEKIYALPWSEAYAKARVRVERGGRWFCNEDDAKAAGFIPWEKS